MRHHTNKILREPLVHFLALGILLFAVHPVLNDELPDSEFGTQIDITSTEVEWLRQNWARQWKRPPTDNELQGLIDDFIREEVLYREAMAMGLDRNDVIVRRRLVQKMEFLSEDMAMQIEPTTDQLRDYFEENIETYRVATRLTFTHIYFSVDRRGEAAEADARRILQELQSASDLGTRASERGDRFMLQYHYALRSPLEVEQLFGRRFAEALFGLEPAGGWQGPIASGYGLHLVHITDRVESRLPTLEDVLDRVRIDFDAAKRNKTNEALYQSLLSRYDIAIEETASSNTAKAAGAAGGAGR